MEGRVKRGEEDDMGLVLLKLFLNVYRVVKNRNWRIWVIESVINFRYELRCFGSLDVNVRYRVKEVMIFLF